jgi:hypothetical protein
MKGTDIWDIMLCSSEKIQWGKPTASICTVEELAKQKTDSRQSHNPEDSTLYSHCCEQRRSNKNMTVWSIWLLTLAITFLHSWDWHEFVSSWNARLRISGSWTRFIISISLWMRLTISCSKDSELGVFRSPTPGTVVVSTSDCVAVTESRHN